MFGGVFNPARECRLLEDARKNSRPSGCAKEYLIEVGFRSAQKQAVFLAMRFSSVYASRLTTDPEKEEPMKRYLFVLGSLACAAVLTQAQTHAPYPPFTAEQARLGKQLVATSLEIRKGITNNSLP